MKNVILIGFMGAGKTTVGERYAKKHGLPMVDTDWLIEERAGMTISEIFAQKGEDEFRRTETAVLQTLLSDTQEKVISVGGGLPLREENRRPEAVKTAWNGGLSGGESGYRAETAEGRYDKAAASGRRRDAACGRADRGPRPHIPGGCRTDCGCEWTECR